MGSPRGGKGARAAGIFRMEAPVRSVKKLRADMQGSNMSQVVELENGEKGIFKPSAGEHPEILRSVGGSLAEREVAAFGVDQALGWGLVPPTVSRTIRGKEGSLQKWVPGQDGGKALLYKVRPGKGIVGGRSQYAIAPSVVAKMDKGEVIRMKAFDHIMGNQDRRFPNLIVSRRGKLSAIDNSFCMTNIPLRSMNAGMEPRVLAAFGVKASDRLGRGEVTAIRNAFGSPGTPITGRDISRVRGLMGNPGKGKMNVPNHRIHGVIERARGIVAADGRVGHMSLAPEPPAIMA